MIPVSEDRRPPLTPQLAMRVAILGSFALAMFAIIFFRLWFLQVLNTRAYQQQASVNQVRDIEVPAPRGQILDASGNVLVSNTQALDVQVTPPNLPGRLTTANVLSQPAVDLRVYRRLARVLGISTAPTRCPVTVISNGRAGQVCPPHRADPMCRSPAARGHAVCKRDRQDQCPDRRAVLHRRAPGPVPRCPGPAAVRAALSAEQSGGAAVWDDRAAQLRCVCASRAGHRQQLRAEGSALQGGPTD